MYYINSSQFYTPLKRTQFYAFKIILQIFVVYSIKTEKDN